MGLQQGRLPEPEAPAVRGLADLEPAGSPPRLRPGGGEREVRPGPEVPGLGSVRGVDRQGRRLRRKRPEVGRAAKARHSTRQGEAKHRGQQRGSKPGDWHRRIGDFPSCPPGTQDDFQIEDITWSREKIVLWADSESSGRGSRCPHRQITGDAASMSSCTGGKTSPCGLIGPHANLKAMGPPYGGIRNSRSPGLNVPLVGSYRDSPFWSIKSGPTLYFWSPARR